jgi:hypothetical protein
VAPDCEWNDVLSFFSLASRKLGQFIAKDLMFANLDTHEPTLLLLVSANHVNFSTTWLLIYIKQNNLCLLPIPFDKLMFFQIKAAVISNAKRQDFVDEPHTPVSGFISSPCTPSGSMYPKYLNNIKAFMNGETDYQCEPLILDNSCDLV